MSQLLLTKEELSEFIEICQPNLIMQIRDFTLRVIHEFELINAGKWSLTYGSIAQVIETGRYYKITYEVPSFGHEPELEELNYFIEVFSYMTRSFATEEQINKMHNE